MMLKRVQQWSGMWNGRGNCYFFIAARWSTAVRSRLCLLLLWTHEHPAAPVCCGRQSRQEPPRTSGRTKLPTMWLQNEQTNQQGCRTLLPGKAVHAGTHATTANISLLPNVVGQQL
jgi:hypothetical protein